MGGLHVEVAALRDFAEPVCSNLRNLGLDPTVQQETEPNQPRLRSVSRTLRAIIWGQPATFSPKPYCECGSHDVEPWRSYLLFGNGTGPSMLACSLKRLNESLPDCHVDIKDRRSTAPPDDSATSGLHSTRPDFSGLSSLCHCSCHNG
jgi:hypothetical protein